MLDEVKKVHSILCRRKTRSRHILQNENELWDKIHYDNYISIILCINKCWMKWKKCIQFPA